MRRRPMALVLTAALIGAVFTALPAKAATEVPETVQIEDPIGDANFLNSGTAPPLGQDNVTGQDASGIGDIVKAWFTVDGDKISAHILTEQAAPGGNGISYNVYAAPGEGEAGSNVTGCIRFWLVVPGTNPGGGSYQGAPIAKLHDRCNTGGNVYDSPDIEYTLEALEDGTGVVTITAPRSTSPLFADGGVLSAPTVVTNSPAVGQTVGPPESWAVVTPTTDNTKPGTDYTVSADSVDPPVIDEPDEPKPPKNPCKKLKGKKKKKCLKKHASKPCTAYQPGELGAEAETSIVTDAATEEVPVEVPLSMDPSVGAFSGEIPQVGPNPLISHAIQNVQVDTDDADTGLYVRVEFPEGEDYDLYLRDAEGGDAAHAGGGNQAPEELGDGTGNGGHSETTAEQLDGVKTADCGGYTVDVANAIGMGEATLKFWLGAPTWDPAAQAPIESGPTKAFVF